MATANEILSKMNELQSEFAEYQGLRAQRNRKATERDLAIAEIAALDTSISDKLNVLVTLRAELKALL